jgi:hypothetical protein
MRITAAVLALLLFLPPFPGCSSGPRSDAALCLSDSQVCQCVPVARIVGPTAGGTGIPLGNNLILTARHVIKDRFLEVDGRWTRYRVVAKGEGPNDDWILIRCRAAPAESSVELAPGYRPKPGEPVFLLGYWQGSAATPVDFRQARRIPLCVVRGKAAARPLSFSTSTDGLLFTIAPLQGNSYHGISGGPVAVYDETSGKFRVVGVYKGSWEMTFLGASQTFHTAVLLPADVLERELQEAPAAPTSRPSGG